MTPDNRRLAASLAALALIFVVLHATVLPPSGFFSGDQGAKYLQTVAFAQHGPFRPGVDIRARDVDPHGEAEILEYRRGRFVGVFSWLLPLLGAPFVRAAGVRGIYAVPMLSALVIFAAVSLLGRLLGDRGGWTGWAVVLCAPVIFYGAELWEHAPAAACVAIAAWLLAPCTGDPRRSDLRCAAAGAAIAVGALFREEAAVALPAFLAALALVQRAGWWRPGACAIAAFAVVLVASVPGNILVGGTPLPLHLVVEVGKSTGYLETRLLVFRQLLLPAYLAPLYVTCALAGVVAALFARRANASGGASERVLLACAWILITAGALVPLWNVVFRRLPQPVAYSLDSVAHTWVFWVAVLFVPVATLRPRDRSEGDASAYAYLLLGAVFTIAGALLIIPSPGGAQWSPRYLFIAAPLLATVAAQAARRDGQTPAAVWTARAALAFAVAMQGLGILYLADAKSRNARITERVATIVPADEIIVSDVPWFPQVTAMLLPSRRILLARSPDQVSNIVGVAAAHGFRSISVVSSLPETHYEPPYSFSTNGCTFERTSRTSVGERGLIVYRYLCGATSGV